METLAERIKRVTQENVSIVQYDLAWPEMFEQEKQHLLACLPPGLMGRIEHFGSTAVPGLAAKPVVDMLIEVASLEQARLLIAPILESQGYDYFWRPTKGDDGPPFYAWFIKRDSRTGTRTHVPAQVRTDLPAHQCETATTHATPGEPGRTTPARRHAGSPQIGSQSVTQPGRRRAQVAVLAQRGGCDLGNVGLTDVGDLRGSASRTILRRGAGWPNASWHAKSTL